ncbi:MAG: hypothetical protein ACT4NX_00365 [Deltaproteobacteria bacterium]
MKFEREETRLGAVINSLICAEVKTPCPGDEEFALYMEQRLDGGRRNALVSHFASCRDCRERLSIPIGIQGFETKESGLRKVFASVWNASAITPAAVTAAIIVALGFGVYIEFPNFIADEGAEVVRGGQLIAVKQMALTPELLEIIRDGDEARIKSALAGALPQGAEITQIAIEEPAQLLGDAAGNLILILYSDGLLKIKPE